MIDKIIKLLGGYTESEIKKLDKTCEKEIDVVREHLEKIIGEYHNENQDLLASIYPHNSLDEFKSSGVSFKTKNKYWKAEFDDGRGEAFRRLHTYLKRTPQETLEFAAYAQELIGDFEKPFKQKYIERLLRNFQDVYFVEYKIEISEFFPSAELILTMLDGGIISEDCDGVAFTLFHLIDSFLDVHFPSERWRIRCAFGEFYGHRMEGHAFCVWANEDYNDWSIIESTIWPERRMQTFDAPLRYNTQYDVQWTFDTEKEYPDLYKR